VGASGQEAAVHGRRIRQWNEWNDAASLDWNLLDFPQHAACKT
jgi:1,4-alpha-glucan branching enzyme